MKLFAFLGILFLLFFPSTVNSQNNKELQRMYTEDQAARLAKEIDWVTLAVQDSIRLARVYELSNEGKIVTSRDHYNAALIFQHGWDTIASSRAVLHMKKAIELDSTTNKWLLAAAIDRDLMRRNKPQIYGTQYITNNETGKWEIYTMDTTQVTDEERTLYNVQTLAEQKIAIRNVNLLSISDYYAKNNSIDKTIMLIKSEKEKGNDAEYHISEDVINNFGYELMGAGKEKEALKVFKLNTELYPEAYNTFDSYGECLLKLRKKKLGLQAYQRSLELNPQNKNAKYILEKYK